MKIKKITELSRRIEQKIDRIENIDLRKELKADLRSIRKELRTTSTINSISRLVFILIKAGLLIDLDSELIEELIEKLKNLTYNK